MSDLPLIKRPSGGGVVVHYPEQLNYTLCVPLSLLTGESLLVFYRKLSEQLLKVLRKQNIEAELVRAKRQGYRMRRIETACEHFPAKYEILERGKKIIGSAQRKGRQALLQQSAVFRNTLNKEWFMRDMVSVLSQYYKLVG